MPAFATVSDHSLSGKVWDVAAQKFLDPVTLARSAASADVVLLGEQHDNPDHHRLQAWMLEMISARGVPPALVAFEQLDFEDQDTVDEVVRSGGDAGALEAAVQWSRSGWPPFEMYRPVFEVALREGMTIRAANLSRARLHGPSALPQLEVPLPARFRDAMAAEIADAHCGYASEHMAHAMIQMQRHRDAAMAEVLASGCGRAPGDAAAAPCVLMAGFGHVRRDRGVPMYLRHASPRLRVLSVAFLEVDGQMDDPAQYLRSFGEERAFDYAWFTPRVERQDPCIEFRQQLQRMRSKGHGV
ncbi:MAG TPA: ChaN family lipoprotein [Candidatus Binatia bacterium]|nr:ChaN family lipoprotein [Candidatus Binatia bacterium]